jgi:5-methylcytosine-specific restriction endonuclease McrA
VDAAKRELVRRRADDCCEYCRLHQKYIELTHHVEHIIARQHGGTDDADNLALACHRCNFHKGPNLSGLDPETRRLTALFHPRRDRWQDHFAFDGPCITGLTAIGRTTVHVLDLNDARRLELREEILKRGEAR